MTIREQQILAWIIENPTISQQELADKANITRSSVAVHISNLMKKGYIVGKGYVVNNQPYITVIGGITKDIGAKSLMPLVPGDSNPSKINISLGGVGCNIAHNCALLDCEVKFLTVLGDDDFTNVIRNSCQNVGIDLSEALQVPYHQNSTYLYIANETGEMALAAVDMEIFEQLKPDYLQSKINLINNSQCVVFDTNIPSESILWLKDNCTVPMFCDPVSTLKAQKIKNNLSMIDTLKPNRLEAEVLTGVKIIDQTTLDQACDIFLSKGVKRIFISLGEEGVYACDKTERVLVLPPASHCVSTTGAGDAFMGGLVKALTLDLSLQESTEIALACATITLSCATTINPLLKYTDVLNLAKMTKIGEKI